MIEFDKQHLRGYIHDELHTRCSSLLEMYSDRTLASRPTKVEPTRAQLEKFMKTWKVEKGPYYDYNTCSVGPGVQDGDNYDDVDLEPTLQKAPTDYLRLAKIAYTLGEQDLEDELYQVYAQTVPTIVTSDDASESFESIRASVAHAATTGSEIELLLDDGSDIILDVHMITRLNNDEQLLKSLIDNLESIHDVSAILDLDIEQEDVDE